jgi:WW domain-containing oxidoreductase
MSNFTFSASSTAEEVVKAFGANAEGKNVIVTGASSGIGIETARVLAIAGAQVWLAGRDLVKTNAIADQIKSQIADSSKVHSIECDLSSLASVRKCVDEFSALNIPLHILINNAGCWFVDGPRKETEDGFEMHIGTNHLGPFLLTKGLIPSLERATTSRIVNLASQAHFRCGINFEDINLLQSYSGGGAYGQSKTANILHACELAKRYGEKGITAVSLHPGVIDTGLWRNGSLGINMNKTVEQGAATSVFCALSPSIKTGLYYNDCNECAAKDWATNPVFANQLWELSLEMTK